jgi:hypothetical protein
MIALIAINALLTPIARVGHNSNALSSALHWMAHRSSAIASAKPDLPLTMVRACATTDMCVGS